MASRPQVALCNHQPRPRLGGVPSRRRPPSCTSGEARGTWRAALKSRSANTARALGSAAPQADGALFLEPASNRSAPRARAATFDADDPPPSMIGHIRRGRLSEQGRRPLMRPTPPSKGGDTRRGRRPRARAAENTDAADFPEQGRRPSMPLISSSTGRDHPKPPIPPSTIWHNRRNRLPGARAATSDAADPPEQGRRHSTRSASPSKGGDHPKLPNPPVMFGQNRRGRLPEQGRRHSTRSASSSKGGGDLRCR